MMVPWKLLCDIEERNWVVVNGLDNGVYDVNIPT
jgi:hypothetical protein